MDPDETPIPAFTALREGPLSLDEVIDLVRDATCGAVCVFLGLVRDHDRGQEVTALDYSAHPSAAERLAEVASQVGQRTPGVRLAAVHRVGALEIGDIAVIVGAASAHREDAFQAARDLIDTLKSEVPIWKHQAFADGGTQWVGLP